MRASLTGPSRLVRARTRTHLGEPVRARGELPQLHVEVFVVRVLLLGLQVMVPLGTRWGKWRDI